MNETKGVIAEHWGVVNGRDVYRYQLRNNNGMLVSISNFGATVTAITTSASNGNPADVVLGYDALQDYLDDPFYMGGLIGRYANRIAGGLVTIEGKKHQLTMKPGGYHHHGGNIGFNKKVWRSEEINHNGFPAIKLQYLSKDGEEGFPGNLLVTVIYSITDNDQLLVDLSAITDQATVLNLTQHTYFNLGGQAGSTILDHELLLPLPYYLPVNQLHVPLGHFESVQDTPFDFTDWHLIGARINDKNGQLDLGAGYDHTWVIKKEDSSELKLAGKVRHPASGRQLIVYTTEPSVHFYAGNYLDGSTPGKGGVAYPRRGGFCLETQHYPDSPNHPHFPSALLRPGATYTSQTIFGFTSDAHLTDE